MSFEDMRAVSTPSSTPSWTSGAQPVPITTAEQAWGWTKFGLGVGAIALLGRYQVTPQKRGFDYMLGAIRAVEEYSPGRVFRTFQVSHMMSALETPSLQMRYFSPEHISTLRKTVPGRAWLEHLSKLTGRSITGQDIMAEGVGFRYEAGQLRTGRYGGETLLRHAGVIRAPTGAGGRFQEAYARSLSGGPLTRGLDAPTTMGATRFETQFADDAFRQRIKYRNAAGVLQREAFMFTGGHTRIQAGKRFVSGYGTALAERINQLARAPFELPGISAVMKKVPIVNRLKFGVIPSSGLRTVSKITAKLGILGTATYMAYNELDYQAREAEVLDETVLGEGISAGVAKLWTGVQVGLSRAAEWTGAHSYKDWQEDTAPGSTELSRLLAFPLIGAAAGLTVGYSQRVLRQRALSKAGLSLGQASAAAGARDAFFKTSIYGGQVPEEIMGALDKRSIALVEAETAKRAAGWEGRFVSKIAKTQQRRTAMGALTRGLGKVTPGRLRWLLGAAAGASLVVPFLPGAMAPSERPEELEALYGGQKRVAIRKGRWWEFGRTPFEGKRIDRFQQHWYPAMLARAKEKAIWGDDAPSPLERWWIENMTYELEKKHYKERPYPITGQAFEDVPFIGPILSNTIGRLVKPSIRMHEEEWTRQGEEGEEVKRMPLKYNETTLPGEKTPGAPVSPYDTKGMMGEQIYRMTEMVGLPGFTMTAIKEAITGRSDTFDQEQQLESAVRMYGAEREYWDKELGGGLGTTELIRRLYPHRRRQIDLYNPIRNQMPAWMPGPGQRAPDFLHGDPYVKIPEGESRLPGPGYQALHPELKGIGPDDYPAIHRFAILADVAPYTDKFRASIGHVRAAIKRKQLTAEEIALYKERMGEVSARKVRRQFTPYKYKERASTPIEKMLAAANKDQAAVGDQVDPSWFQQAVGTYWETLTHNADTPLESLTPVSPTAKLVHQRTAVEDYEKFQVWGTENAFWGHPIRDFFGPFFNQTAHNAGWEGIPQHVEERRDLEEYFDILEYVKYTRLKTAARVSGNSRAVAEYEDKRRETLFGINPYTFNFSHIFRSLPRRERDYFNAFSEADMEERVQIMKMVPENEQALLLARWRLKDNTDLQKAMKKGLLSEEQVEKADAIQEQLFEDKGTEGFPKTQDLWAEYIATRLPEESYPDWYRRMKLLEKKLDGKPLPGPDWVGWHPAVDLDDIKLKIVQNEGENAYDYDLWPDRIRAVARRPVITEAAEALDEDVGDASDLRARIIDVLSANNISASHISLTRVVENGQTEINLDLAEDRLQSNRADIRRMLNG